MIDEDISLADVIEEFDQNVMMKNFLLVVVYINQNFDFNNFYLNLTKYEVVYIDNYLYFNKNEIINKHIFNDFIYNVIINGSFLFMNFFDL